MNKILSTIVAALIAVSFTAVAFGATKKEQPKTSQYVMTVVSKSGAEMAYGLYVTSVAIFPSKQTCDAAKASIAIDVVAAHRRYNDEEHINQPLVICRPM